MKRDDLATVLDVACLTGDRDRAEQRALLAVALDLDVDFGSFASSNFRNARVPMPPRHVRLVRETYEDAQEEHVDLTKEQAKRYQRLLDKWVRCEKCELPVGAHESPTSCK